MPISNDTFSLMIFSEGNQAFADDDYNEAVKVFTVGWPKNTEEPVWKYM